MTEVSPVLARLCADTAALHERLDHGLDIIARLTDPAGSEDILARYAALYVPLEAAASRRLDAVTDLDLASRRRTHALARYAAPSSLPFVAPPCSTAEALGILYVLEGSTLGGRIILRQLQEHGVDDPRLKFLDPYGADTGPRWRSFLAVLSRETGGDAARIEDASHGAITAFRHAEQALSQEAS